MARNVRPPVIAVMGHIDHGKSSLLDYIRKENSVAGEAGGITQHVAAYIAEHAGRHITFLDTPGHEAFKSLRARGAAAADIAILVLAADEGVKPQTLDALEAIREAAIPYVVAITKIDKNNADPERAKRSLMEHNVFIEEMGGDIPCASISSKTGEGVPELLDLVLLAADLIELTADAAEPASGYVLESTQDPKRGASATLIIKDGTLTLQQFVVAGDAYAPVRFIEDFGGKRVEQAGPSTPAQISGFSKLPPAGTSFEIAKTKKEAEAAARLAATVAQTAPTRSVGTQTVELPLIVKADVAGSIDAIAHELGKVPQERVSLRIIASGVGSVSEGDVKMARAAGADIIAFNAQTDAIARDLADRDGIAINSFSIIYELTEHVAAQAAARAPKVDVDEELGRATILRTFSSTAKKKVVGAKLASGVFTLKDMVKIMRGEEEVGRAVVTNLQQARANVSEVRTEGDFGMELETRADVEPRDILIPFHTITT